MLGVQELSSSATNCDIQMNNPSLWRNLLLSEKLNLQLSPRTILMEESSKHHVMNDDVLEMILFHLLPIFVLRLKAVCKRWRKLISDPSFRRRHTVYYLQYHHQSSSSSNPASSSSHVLPSIFLQPQAICNKKPQLKPSQRQRQRHQQPQSLLLLLLDHDRFIDTKLNPPPDLSFSFIFDNYPDVISIDNSYCFKLLHSSNGLLLLSSLRKQQRDNHNIPLVVDAFVCNPLTKDYIKLPPMDVQGVAPAAMFAQESAPVVTLLGMNLVCNPCESFHYKVVSIIGINNQQQNKKNTFDGLDVYSYYHFKVYSSKSRTWEFSKNYHVGPCAPMIVNGVVLNSVIYWPPPPLRNTNTNTNTNGSQGVLRFDLQSLCLRSVSVSLPPLPHNYTRIWNYFGESGGNLYLIETYTDFNDLLPGSYGCTYLSRHNIWEMNNIQDCCSCSWTLKFHIIADSGFFRPLYVSMNSEEEMLLAINFRTDMYSLILKRNDSNNPSDLKFKWQYIGVFSLLARSYKSTSSSLFPFDRVPYTSTLFPLV